LAEVEYRILDPVFIPGGRHTVHYTGFSTMSQDSGNNSIELSVDELRAHMAAIIASSDDAIISKDLNGIIRSWNTGAEHVFGYAASEIIGRSILTIIPENRRDEEVQILERLKRGERVDHFQTVRLRKDGKAIDISVTISPIKDLNGKIIGASKIARDVTELNRAHRERERLYDLGKAMADEQDATTLVQAITDVATELSGAQFGAFFYNVKDNRGESYMLYTLSGVALENFSKFPMPRNTDVFAPTFSGKGVVRSDDITKDPRYGRNAPRHGMPDGHLPVRSYLAVPVLSRSGAVLGGLFFGHAIPGIFNEHSETVVSGIAGHAALALDNAQLHRDTEQLLEAERAARSEAERVSRMKDEFLATLSHELRTPLNAILGWSQIMQNAEDQETIKEGVVVIQRNARVQTQLIEDLLDMSRIVSGKIRLDVQRVDLAAIVDLAVESLRPAADAKSIRLRKVLDPLAGPVSGDINRLQQIVWNLLSNAIKFTPKNGKVEVLVERVNSHLEITVTDNGQGIKAEFLPYVFERFRQADASTTRQSGGLGLGLAIVKQLVELHGGHVRVKSAGEGQGATFSVTLPLALTKHEDSAREHPAALRPSPVDDRSRITLEGLKVLVVEDEQDARDLISRLLTDAKAEVITAESADEGIRKLRANPPDILISDIGLPHKDGYAFMRDVRAMPDQAVSKIPAIALTAFARSEDRTRAMMAGYQVHISKPIEPIELLATIASLVGRTGREAS
jgi:PAS domain S-box-containing protein